MLTWTARSGRIIPARAGFTRRPRGWRRLAGDHPRSRGVYPASGWNAPATRGSSPLARGLPGSARSGAAGIRIIPARAGFTARRRCPRRRSRDHPRSRGVYRRIRRVDDGHQGSSPLARGLPSWSPTLPTAWRIIPARAGFTAIRFPNVIFKEDHPRSRGVYVRRENRRAGRKGSSPLARGLLTDDGRKRAALRIIPARAGFTVRFEGGPPADGDHPRSRGVYSSGTRVPRRERGSSPLARGLLLFMVRIFFLRGIIPARAGFTHALPGGSSASSDHPRSRGVYWTTGAPAPVSPGSSPLARGLRPISWAPPSRWSDHPRSRGVYFDPQGIAGEPQGSSPLARGLPVGDHPGQDGPGIIPARAGFTRPPTSRRRRPRDHPRSRGVYGREGGRNPKMYGSSPLARGLRFWAR